MQTLRLFEKAVWVVVVAAPPAALCGQVQARPFPCCGLPQRQDLSPPRSVALDAKARALEKKIQLAPGGAGRGASAARRPALTPNARVPRRRPLAAALVIPETLRSHVHGGASLLQPAPWPSANPPESRPRAQPA